MYPNLSSSSNSGIKPEKVHKYIIFILYFFFPLVTWSQLVSPEGKFLQDSIKVGEEIPYVLSIKYPDDQTLIFPDSSYDFSPFELVRKKYAATVSSDGYSFDSVTYYLRSFELEPYQTFRLPVFMIDGTDSVAVFAAADTIFLDDVEVTQDASLKETTRYWEVPLQFNYPYLIGALVLLLLIIIVVLLIFGKQILRKIKLYRLRKAHEKFLEQYDRFVGNLKATDSKNTAEKSLNFWKRYMEKLEKIPYTKLTTKEVKLYHDDGDFQSALRNIDKNIYGKYNLEEVFSDLSYLKTYADYQYQRKVEEVNKNG